MERQENPEFDGIVEDGVVRSPGVRDLPDGTRVSVRVVERKRKAKPKARSARPAPKGRKSQASPEMLRLAGIIKDAPRDASYNLDHYLYGTPKKKRR